MPLDVNGNDVRSEEEKQDKKLPPGVVLGPDGKPYVLWDGCNGLHANSNDVDAAHVHQAPLGKA